MATSSIGAAPSSRGGRRAMRPGARAVIAAAVLAIIAAVVLVLVLTSGGGQSYGQLPGWLPESARQLDKNPAPPPEVATPTHAMLSLQQGYPVQVQLPSGSAAVTITGPAFPSYVTRYAQSNLWPTSRLVPSTFYVTLTKVHGTIPLKASAFTTLTALGTIEPSRLAAKGGAAVPGAVHSGQTVTVEVKTRTVEGQGSIRWSPLSTKVLAAWMYQLELD